MIKSKSCRKQELFVGYLETEFNYADAHLVSRDKTTLGRTGFAKRVMDIFISAAALFFLLPALVIVAALVKISSKGTILHRQNRIGLNGVNFSMMKFRSMYADGEEKLNALLETCPTSKAKWDIYQKLENDPRVTRIGHFLRKSSIDELPQLVNVLLGNMSIVGPRPLLPHQKLAYGATNFHHYIRSRPGITGLWQVSGRNALPFERRAELDTEYSENWSIAYDVKLLFKTIPVVLLPSGAF